MKTVDDRENVLKVNRKENGTIIRKGTPPEASEKNNRFSKPSERRGWVTWPWGETWGRNERGDREKKGREGEGKMRDSEVGEVVKWWRCFSSWTFWSFIIVFTSSIPQISFFSSLNSHNLVSHQQKFRIFNSRTDAKVSRPSYASKNRIFFRPTYCKENVMYTMTENFYSFFSLSFASSHYLYYLLEATLLELSEKPFPLSRGKQINRNPILYGCVTVSRTSISTTQYHHHTICPWQYDYDTIWPRHNISKKKSPQYNNSTAQYLQHNVTTTLYHHDSLGHNMSTITLTSHPPVARFISIYGPHFPPWLLLAHQLDRHIVLPDASPIYPLWQPL